VQIFDGERLWLQADAAEAWLAGALRPPGEGGPSGLLWVRQGQIGFDADAAGRTARRDLMATVAGEVAAMTGGRRMEAALARCREELATHLTATGRAREGGPLKAAADAVETLATREAELAGAARSLRAEIDRRRDTRRALASIEDAEEAAARKDRLRAAEAALVAAERHAGQLDRAGERLQAARRAVDLARDRLATLRTLRREAMEAAARAATEAASADRAEGARQAAQASVETARSLRDAARDGAAAASEARRRADAEAAAAAASDLRAELASRIDRAEALRRISETEAAAASAGPEAEGLRRLEAMAETVAATRRIRDQAAPSLTIRYGAGAEGRIRDAAGTPLPGDTPLPMPDGATLDIDGIGTIALRPGAGGDRAALARAETALSEALAAAGFETLQAARAAAAAAAAATARHRDAQTEFRALAPDGIAALRRRLAALPVPAPQDGDTPPPDPATAEAAEVAARQALGSADAGFEAARAVLETAGQEAARSRAAQEAAVAQAERAAAALEAAVTAENGDADAAEGARSTAFASARTALDAAHAAHAALAADAPDVEAARITRDRAKSAADRAEAEAQGLRVELGRLDATIAHKAGDAVDEELAEAHGRLAAARARHAALSFEVAVLQRLAGALETARDAARDRFLEPVKRELSPLLRLMWPEAELRFDAEAVLPQALVRDGREEPLDILSGGAREQVALLVRLAFARLLAQAGTPAPVILDDAIVHSDDDRIERLFDALTRQARDQQIIVLTCRQRAFRDLGGTGLRFEPG